MGERFLSSGYIWTSQWQSWMWENNTSILLKFVGAFFIGIGKFLSQCMECHMNKAYYIEALSTRVIDVSWDPNLMLFCITECRKTSFFGQNLWYWKNRSTDLFNYFLRMIAKISRIEIVTKLNLKWYGCYAIEHFLACFRILLYVINDFSCSQLFNYFAYNIWRQIGKWLTEWKVVDNIE